MSINKSEFFWSPKTFTRVLMAATTVEALLISAFFYKSTLIFSLHVCCCMCSLHSKLFTHHTKAKACSDIYWCLILP